VTLRLLTAMRSRAGRSRSIVAYGSAVLAVGAVTLLRLALEPLLHGRAPFTLYYLPILLVAWYGGVGPTILATALSLAATTFLVAGSEQHSPVTVGVFLVVASAMVVMARAARSTQEARSYLASIVESSDDAIVTKDLQGVIQSWNGGAERLFGYTAGEIVGRPVLTLIPPEHQDEEHHILNQLRHGERIEHFETVRLAKGGRRLDVSLTVSPVRDRFGDIIGASKVARDISERKRAAEVLAAEREWLRRTLESIGDAVIATDAAGRVVFMNPVAERLTGWSTAKARGESCDEVFRIVNESSRQVVESPVGRVLRLGIVVGLANSTLLIAADGTELPIDDSGAPIRGLDGELRGVVLVFRDISDRRRVEAERSDAMAERGRLLARERAARNEAEQANRSKDEFVAMVSHELRTPLNAITGWTQILKGNPEDPELIRRGIEVIERNTRTQEQLIADLLDMSRIISGKLRLDVGAVDLITLTKTAIETIRPAADAKGIAVECSLDPSVSATTGDPTRLQQCMWNLLSNAIKFTPQGGRVSIRLGRSESHIEMKVSDNGIGIRPDFLPFVFERFRQEETPANRRFGGLGLGLAIVKQLVELHGGQVAVESAGLGHGATFTLAFPIRALRAESLPAVAGRDGGAASLDHVTVLLVEDDPDNRDVLRRLLEQHRAAIATAASAREALDMIPKVRPSILVSDIGLPEIDGYELIERVRQMEPAAGGRIPAIALTAHASTDDRTRALSAGYQAHIAKPVEPRELVATIASLAGLMARQTSDAPP
jgi:PAS domain S-box-containing protein